MWLHKPHIYPDALDLETATSPRIVEKVPPNIYAGRTSLIGAI